MIRRFNYTGRKKIPRSEVSFSLIETPENYLAFDASVHLENLSLPDSANIFIEAYHYRRAYFRRFPCGTISNPKFPKNCVLEGLNPGERVMFRIKVVDNKGRILAAADRIMPRRRDEEPSGKLCLLHVEFVDLGDSIWRLDLESDWPRIELNKHIENIREIARSETSFLTLVYPEVVRQVLYEIVVEQDYTDPATDPDDWMSGWLDYSIQLLGTRCLPPSGDGEPVKQEKLKWIDDAVAAFCSKNQVLKKFIKSQKMGEP